MSDLLWAGQGDDDKLFVQSGLLEDTIKTSVSVNSFNTNAKGVSCDGTNTPFAGQSTGDGSNTKLYLMSGIIESTIKTSLDLNAVTGTNETMDVTWDGTNTPWVEDYNPTTPSDNFMYIQSGQFESTIKSSLSLSLGAGGLIYPRGTSCDLDGDMLQNRHAEKQFKMSGQTTNIVKTSISRTSIEASACGISFDGEHTPFVGWTDLKAYYSSGQFTSTLKDSTATVQSPHGCEASDNNARLGISGFTPTAVIF